VVAVVGLMAMIYFQRPFAEAVGARRTVHWRNLWIVATLCVFFIFSYWPFILITGLIVIVLSRAEPLRPAIFLLLFVSMPAMGDAIPGFAGINKFIVVTPVTMLTFAILLPAMFNAKRMSKPARAGGGADLCFLLYLLLQIALCTRAPTFTHILRTMIESTIAMAPIYYVFSRYPRSLEDIRVLSAAFLYPMLALAAISIPEIVRGWHLYTGSLTIWFGDIAFSYTVREGFLRAAPSVFDPIVWGVMSMAAIGVGLAFFNEKFSSFHKLAAFGLLTAGLITSLSRGPWVGAAATLVIFVLISPRASSRIVQLGAAGFALSLASLATPFGKTVISLIPFIGDSQSATISYRQALLRAAREVMMENPFFGSGSYLDNPKLAALRQGQGIIDIVNTYLQVGLDSGFIGLALFIGVFAFALLSLRSAMKSARRHNPQLALYCRAYFATMIGLMITIFTTSSVFQTPTLTWAMAGMCVALARIERQERMNGAKAETPDNPPSQPKQFDWK